MEIDELEYEISKDGRIRRVIIQEIRPCIVAENMVRVLLQLDSKVDDVIPFLVTKYPPGKVNYIENKNILTLNVHKRLVTIYPSGKISMNKTIDKEDAIRVVTDIMQTINLSYVEMEDNDSLDFTELKEKLSNIGPLALYNCLPKTDCEQCGEVTCMAFSIKLLAGETTLDKCTPLKQEEDVSCLEELLGHQIMKTMGWKSEKNKL